MNTISSKFPQVVTAENHQNKIDKQNRKSDKLRHKSISCSGKDEISKSRAFLGLCKGNTQNMFKEKKLHKSFNIYKDSGKILFLNLMIRF